MPRFNPKRFANPKALQSVSPEVLREFLAPHREFIKDKGFDLPDSCAAMSDFDYLMLTSILMTPSEHMPAALVDALYFIHEMATEGSVDKMIAAAEAAEIDLPDESTPMDMAMRIWNADPVALERAHSERHIYRSRTFEYYRAEKPLPPGELSEERLLGMERELDSWFTAKKRGRNSKVFAYPGEGEVWFLIRHGDTFKRESAVDGYKSKSLFYRPEAFDVACYLPECGELRVHAKNKGERDLYRREFGRLIAGDSEFFPSLDKYTLLPLIESGESALLCRDIDGLEWIRLVELQIRKRTTFFDYTVTYSGADVFAVLRHRDEKLSAKDTLRRAKFTVKFARGRKCRSVTLTPPNRVELSRDEDAELVEEWLRRRGFVESEVGGVGRDSSDILVGM